MDGLVAKLCLTLVTPRTVACQAPLYVVFSRQGYWSGLPFPSPIFTLRSFKSSGSYQEGYNLFFPCYYLWFYVTNHFNGLARKSHLKESLSISTFYSSGPQPYWHQGLVVWKTIFQRTRGRRNGFGMIQAHP